MVDPEDTEAGFTAMICVSVAVLGMTDAEYDHYADEIVEDEKVVYVSESISDGSESRRLLVKVFKVEELISVNSNEQTNETLTLIHSHTHHLSLLLSF